MSMIGHLLRVSDAELQAYRADSARLEDRLYRDAGPDPALVDIDKTWDGVVFLLTGQPLSEATHPLVRVLFSGQLVDEAQDLGYGPAHYLTAAEVAELHPQLAAVGPAELRRNFDPVRMTALGIYPGIWAEGDDAFAYVADGVATVQQLYAEAARRGQGMITFIS